VKAKLSDVIFILPHMFVIFQLVPFSDAFQITREKEGMFSIFFQILQIIGFIIA